MPATPAVADPRVGVELSEEDRSRCALYRVLGKVLVAPPDRVAREALSGLRGDDSPLGQALNALAAQAADLQDDLEREYHDLFIGLGRGELLPYGSFYIAGFLHERPLARLREELGLFGIDRVEGNYEPEDHAATLCEIMAGIVGGSLPAPDGAEQRIFEKHLLPWIGRFFADLEHANAASFYRSVGTLGRVFMDIEKEAFALPS